MKTDGLIGGLYILTEWLMRFSVTNILWLFFNIPIFIVSLNLFIAETQGEKTFYLIVVMALLPFFTFPASTAIFGLARKWVFNEPDSSIFRSFWKYYKENYLKSMLGGLILVMIWAVLILDYLYFTKNIHELTKYLFFALFFFTAMFTLHFFSNIVHFRTTLFVSLKNALYMTLKNPILSLITILIHSGIYIVSFKIAPFLFLFFTISLIAYLSFLLFYKISLNTGLKGT